MTLDGVSRNKGESLEWEIGFVEHKDEKTRWKGQSDSTNQGSEQQFFLVRRRENFEGSKAGGHIFFKGELLVEKFAHSFCYGHTQANAARNNSGEKKKR